MNPVKFHQALAGLHLFSALVFSMAHAFPWSAFALLLAAASLARARSLEVRP